MARVYNFSAGPSMLPESVLQRAAEEMMDYQGSGQSVMEMSHRSKVYEPIIFGARDLFREVLNVPDNYEILFLQGGASTQFAAIPLNFMNGSGKADYILSGQFSTKAWQEACKYGEAKAVASSKADVFTHIPDHDPSMYTPDADYFYICYNNTIYGTRFTEATLPKTGDVPLFADVSSCFLSEPMDVSRFDLIYGGAQKNIAPAGLTVVIVRKDLLGNARDVTPTMLNYAIMAEKDSMYNTPPCYTIYICKLVLEWIKSIGGLDAMKLRNEKKAGILYDYLDKSDLFIAPVLPRDRSIMNVVFRTGDEALDAEFVKCTLANGLQNVKGHRSVGGMRASIYNAMPVEGVEKLVAVMKEFEVSHHV